MKGGAAKVEVATLAHSFTQMMLLGLLLKLKVSSEEDKLSVAGFGVKQDSCCSKLVQLHVNCAFVLFSSESTAPYPCCSLKIMSDCKTNRHC